MHYRRRGKQAGWDRKAAQLAFPAACSAYKPPCRLQTQNGCNATLHDASLTAKRQDQVNISMRETSTNFVHVKSLTVDGKILSLSQS